METKIRVGEVICFALQYLLCSVRSCSWIHGTVSRDQLYFVVVNH